MSLQKTKTPSQSRELRWRPVERSTADYRREGDLLLFLPADLLDLLPPPDLADPRL
jgi:hypothetical protein